MELIWIDSTWDDGEQETADMGKFSILDLGARS